MERWPNFFIVGAPKAGTTSIYEYIKNHPQIFMSSIKEPNYFSINILNENDQLKPIRNKKKYLDLFKNIKNEKIIGEASPFYLSDHDAPKLIHDVAPTAKILISIRDPVEREFSHFLMHYVAGETVRTFHDQLQIEIKNHQTSSEYFALKHGMYYENIKRYLDIFDKNQVKIIIFEEFIRNTEKSLQSLFDFLNIDLSIPENVDQVYNQFALPRNQISSSIIRNQTLKKIVKNILPRRTSTYIYETFFVKKGYKKPDMKNEDRELLVRFYENDVEKIKTLLGRELPWSNFQNAD